jgi:hypothetical protein
MKLRKFKHSVNEIQAQWSASNQEVAKILNYQSYQQCTNQACNGRIIGRDLESKTSSHLKINSTFNHDLL